MCAVSLLTVNPILVCELSDLSFSARGDTTLRLVSSRPYLAVLGQLGLT